MKDNIVQLSENLFKTKLDIEKELRANNKSTDYFRNS
jgi:hypothetical protein